MKTDTNVKSYMTRIEFKPDLHGEIQELGWNYNTTQVFHVGH